MDNLTDSDLLEMGVKRKRNFSWSTLLFVLTLVAAGGFVVSGYLPLHRAHATLQAEYSTLAPKARELDDALQATKAELEKVDKRREELQDAEDARASLRKTGKENFKELKTILADELAKPIFRKQVVVLYGPTRLRVKFKSGLFKPNSVDVSPGGEKELCKVATAIEKKKKLKVAVVGHTAKDAVPTALAKDYDNAWQYTSATAGSVAGVMQTACKFPSERLEALGVADRRSKAGDGVTLEITLAETEE